MSGTTDSRCNTVAFAVSPPKCPTLRRARVGWEAGECGTRARDEGDYPSESGLWDTLALFNQYGIYFYNRIFTAIIFIKNDSGFLFALGTLELQK